MVTRVRLRDIVLALGIGCLWTACRDEQTAGPEGVRPASSSLVKAASGQSKQPQLMRCLARNATQGSATVGPDGGTLYIGESQLIIPAGALPNPVLVTGAVIADTVAAIEFQPHGLQFQIPATLLISAKGCPHQKTAAEVAYIDDSFQVLEELPATFDAKHVVVAANISHFSGYAIAW